MRAALALRLAAALCAAVPSSQLTSEQARATACCAACLARCTGPVAISQVECLLDTLFCKYACTDAGNSQCPAGKYRTACSTMGSTACSSTCPACTSGKYLQATCNGYDPAVCPTCSLCAAGKFQTSACTSTSDTVCKGDCPSNANSAEGSLTIYDCKCNAGFYGYAGASCSACPAYTNSIYASDSRDDCKCSLGYYGPDGGPCAACPNGKYGKGADGYRTSEDAGCEACPAGKKGAGGSGYANQDAGCVACASPTYTVDPGSVACLSCPRGKRYVAADKPCSNCSGSLGPTSYWFDNCGTRGCWSDANHYFSGPASCGCYGVRGGGVCTQNSDPPYVPECTNTCPVGFCNNLENNQYWSGTRVSAGTTARNTRTSPTSCARSTCNNALKTQYYPGPSGDVRDRFSATSCPVQACTNARNDQYYNGTGGTAAPTADACPVAPCTLSLAAGYYFSAPGTGGATSCAVSRCTNPILNNQYYTGGGGVANNCPASTCDGSLPFGSYWSSNGFSSRSGCAYTQCSNKPPNSVYTPEALNLGPACDYLCNAGYYREPAAGTCSPCQPGTFSAQGAVGSCTACVRGVHYPESNAVYDPVGEGQTGCQYRCNLGYSADFARMLCVVSSALESDILAVQKFALVGDLVPGQQTRLARLNLTSQTTDTLTTLPYAVIGLALHASGDFAVFTTYAALGAVYRVGLKPPFAVSLLAGSATEAGFANGRFQISPADSLMLGIPEARFNRVTQIAAPRALNVILLMDQTNTKIRKLDLASETASTVASTTSVSPFDPALSVSPDSTFAVYSFLYGRLYKLDLQTEYSTFLAGSGYGFQDGAGSQAKFQAIGSTAVSSDSRYVYVRHPVNDTACALRVVDLSASPAAVRTLVSADPRVKDSAISTNPTPGRVWLASSRSYTVSEVTVAQDLSGVSFAVVYGQAGAQGVQDDLSPGTTHVERFNSPQWVTAWACGKRGYECDKSDAYALPCLQGRTSDGFSGCQDCPAGTFARSPASPECTPCAQGTYAQYTLSTACEACAPSCRPSSYFSGCGGANPGGCLPCPQDCSPGQSRSDCGGSTQGNCSRCQNSPLPNQYYAQQCSVAPCPGAPIPGSYWNTTGACLQQACSNAPARASYTAAENLQPACAYQCDRGYTGADCQPCAQGTYWADGACSPCDRGSYQPSQAATACLQCPAGSSAQDRGSSACRLCAQGSYSASRGAAECTPCALGQVSPSNATACADCQPGYFSAQLGASQCLPCQPGTYAGGAGSQECLPCQPGTFAASAGGAACSPCGVNSYAPLPQSGNCSQCPDNLYAPQQGQTACVACPAGSYVSSASGTRLCVECPNGHVSSQGSASCSPCPAGTAAVPQVSREACQPCQPGYVSGYASSSCAPCAPGTYQHPSSPSACLPCAEGTAAAAGGSVGCEACPGGYTAPRGSAKCRACTAGTFHDPAASNATCRPCAAGLYSLRAALACQACPAGSYAPSEVGPCVPCAPDSFAALPGQSACAACGDYTYQNASGGTTCEPCPARGNATLLPAAGGVACPFECNAGFVLSGDACRRLDPSRHYAPFSAVVALPTLTPALLEKFRAAVARALGVPVERVFATLTRPIVGGGRRLLQDTTNGAQYQDTTVYFLVETLFLQEVFSIVDRVHSSLFQASLNDASKAQDLPALVVRVQADPPAQPPPPPPPPPPQPMPPLPQVEIWVLPQQTPAPPAPRTGAAPGNLPRHWRLACLAHTILFITATTL